MSVSGFPQFETLAVVGLGLIGGSFAKDVRRLGLAKNILGYEQNTKYHREIYSRNLADYVAEVPDEKLAEAQLVILAVPVKSFAQVLSQLHPHLAPDVILTDVGSVKSPLLQLMRSKKYANICFIGGHPIAGAERFGPSAAQDNLFRGKRFIITPDENTAPETLLTVRRLWETLGAVVLEMKAEIHDQIFASVSHLPHLLAYATIQAIADSDTPEALEHSGAGLKDFSRIASSSPEMWADIFLENQKHLLPRIKIFQKVIHSLENAIQNEDREKLIQLLTQAKTGRDRWMTETEPPDKNENKSKGGSRTALTIRSRVPAWEQDK